MPMNCWFLVNFFLSLPNQIKWNQIENPIKSNSWEKKREPAKGEQRTEKCEKKKSQTRLQITLRRNHPRRILIWSTTAKSRKKPKRALEEIQSRKSNYHNWRKNTKAKQGDAKKCASSVHRSRYICYFAFLAVHHSQWQPICGRAVSLSSQLPITLFHFI